MNAGVNRLYMVVARPTLVAINITSREGLSKSYFKLFKHWTSLPESLDSLALLFDI